ncbi:TPA: translocation/assembly module TamB [Morganella morganii]|uniref:autotransporter assembly complex protein TamB n=1 Tax=Morganella morganii TaxID=582 RepID=UPI00302DC5EF|nr:translocation/assembly module TamB [Morganella morganii]
MKWLKYLKWPAIILLVLILLIGGTLGWILGTQSGLHFALNLAPRVVSGLAIGQVEGDLRNLTLKQVKYTMPGIDVSVDKVNLALRLGCLKDMTLCIENLSTDGTRVAVDTAKLPPSEETPPSEPLTELNAPLTIFLDSLSVTNTQVTVDDMAVNLDTFRTAMTWQGDQLTLKPTVINALSVVLPKSDPAAAEEPAPAADAPEKPLGETISEIFAQPMLAELPEVILPLNISVEGISGENWQVSGDAPVTINSLHLALFNKGQVLTLSDLSADAPQGNIAVSGEVALSEKWPVALSVKGHVRDFEEFSGQDLDLTLNGGLLDELKLALALKGPVNATLDAQTNLTQADLPLLLTLESQKVSWPLTGEADYQLDGVKLRLNGKVSGYDLSLRSDIKGKDIPPALLTLDAKGNTEQLNLTRLRLNALQGFAEVTGVADWQKAISWQAVLTLSGLNTAKAYPEWPAKVDGKISTRGSLYGGNWELEIPDITLDGKVKTYPLKARGNVKGNAGGQWTIPELKLALGNNKLDVRGELADAWKLDADINAPALGGLVPGLAGTVKGKLNVRGNMEKPQVLADLAVNSLKWQNDLSVADAKIKGDITSAEQIKGQLDVTVNQLKQADLVISNLTLNAKGTEAQHQLKLVMKGEPVSAQLMLNGGFDRKTETWKGTLNNTRFDTPVGEWSLSKAMALTYLNEKQEVTIGTHCWVNPDARICVPKPITAGASGNASVAFERFDLAMIKPFLGPDTRLNGVFSGNANVRWFADGSQPVVDASLKGNGVKVVQNLDGTNLPVAFDTLTMTAAMKNGKLNLQWLIAIAGNGKINGNVQISDLEKRRQLSGNVGIDNISLDLLKPLLGKGDKATGRLNAGLRLGGNAASPLLFGQLGLSDLAVSGRLLPFDITTGGLTVNFDGARSDLSGNIKTPEGYLNLSGNADWRRMDAWSARIFAQGDKLRVSLPPMIRIDVSPDLVFEATPSMLKLDGTVNIPWARITVHEVPESAVSATSDEVMLDDNLQPIREKQTSIPILSNLRIHIGDDVLLDAFGLKAKLTGDLKVAQDKQGLGLNGQVDIPRGRFHAYGQDLLVRKGQILFSGPADQPFLNLEAIRNPDNTANGVIAGVRVTGLADRPKVEIFSDPAMSQENALSYLLRGEGLDSGDADSSQMTSMLISLGVAQSGQLVGKIGETFGISDLALDTQGVGDKSQVVVSGKITNDLQVKYGVGIFDSLATLTLRYRLMPRLYLEAVSGVNQAIDLLYQFEF